jgi:hypothetical protein
VNLPFSQSNRLVPTTPTVDERIGSTRQDTAFAGGETTTHAGVAHIQDKPACDPPFIELGTRHVVDAVHPVLEAGIPATHDHHTTATIGDDSVDPAISQGIPVTVRTISRGGESCTHESTAQPAFDPVHPELETTTTHDYDHGGATTTTNDESNDPIIFPDQALSGCLTSFRNLCTDIFRRFTGPSPHPAPGPDLERAHPTSAGEDAATDTAQGGLFVEDSERYHALITAATDDHPPVLTGQDVPAVDWAAHAGVSSPHDSDAYDHRRTESSARSAADPLSPDLETWLTVTHDLNSTTTPTVDDAVHPVLEAGIPATYDPHTTATIGDDPVDPAISQDIPVAVRTIVRGRESCTHESSAQPAFDPVHPELETTITHDHGHGGATTTTNDKSNDPIIFPNQAVSPAERVTLQPESSHESPEYAHRYSKPSTVDSIPAETEAGLTATEGDGHYATTTTEHHDEPVEVVLSQDTPIVRSTSYPTGEFHTNEDAAHTHHYSKPSGQPAVHEGGLAATAAQTTTQGNILNNVPSLRESDNSPAEQTGSHPRISRPEPRPTLVSQPPPASSSRPHTSSLHAFPLDSRASEETTHPLFSLQEGTSTASTTSPGTPTELTSEPTRRPPKKVALLIGISYKKAVRLAAERAQLANDLAAADIGDVATAAVEPDEQMTSADPVMQQETANQDGQAVELKGPHSDCKEWKSLLIGKGSPHFLMIFCSLDGSSG